MTCLGLAVLSRELIWDVYFSETHLDYFYLTYTVGEKECSWMGVNTFSQDCINFVISLKI